MRLVSVFCVVYELDGPVRARDAETLRQLSLKTIVQVGDATMLKMTKSKDRSAGLGRRSVTLPDFRMVVFFGVGEEYLSFSE